MKKTLTLIGLCLLMLQAAAQDQARYDALIREAYALYEQKQFAASAARYSDAFKVLGWKGAAEDRYNAACSWALAGVEDSAFFNLQRLVEKQNYANLKQILPDPDLEALHDDPRWGDVIDRAKANKDRTESHMDVPLGLLLDSIHDEDQALRQQLDEVEAQYGNNSKEMKAHWRKINARDSTNLIAVKKILDKRGWLGADVVGVKGNSTLFLVIQHADLETQEHYLPMMRDAAKHGRAESSSLALLEDRVLMRNGNKQIYGSQIGRDPVTGEFFVSPLEDPDNVDKRRAEVGLGPLAEYLQHWDMVWDVEAYKAALPALEERMDSQRK